MEQLINLVEEYLRFRSKLLRRLEDSMANRKEIMEAIRLSEQQLLNRKRKPEAWTNDELIRLATYLRLDHTICFHIRKLPVIIDLMPVAQRFYLLRRISIDSTKMHRRRANYNTWKTEELRLLVVTLQNMPVMY